MKELWTTNPFHLMNSPFAEMGYSSSEPNIVPAHLLLAIRTPLAGPPRVIRSLPAQHPLTQTDALIPLCAQAVGITGGGLLVSALLTLCSPSACFPRNIRRLPASHLPMPRAPPFVGPCTTSAISPQTIRHRAAHPLAPCTASVIARRNIRWHSPRRPLPPLQAIRRREAMPLTACTSEPSSRTATLSPRKNTYCTIVNCPLQIKPVFYFLFTSTAPPAHRIRVKSSLLRLGRFCLALPFTHLGKDIT